MAVPLGAYMARIYDGERVWLSRIFGPLERALYRLAGIRAEQEMSWRPYAGALLLFSAASFVVVYALQRLQGLLPLNPAALGSVTSHLAFNTAVSFATNTNWQSYGGETTLSYLTQMVGSRYRTSFRRPWEWRCWRLSRAPLHGARRELSGIFGWT